MGRMQACGHTSEHGAALDALVDLPLGHGYGDAALLELGGAGGNHARRIKGAHGQAVAFLRQDGLDEVRGSTRWLLIFTGSAPVVALAHS